MLNFLELLKLKNLILWKIFIHKNITFIEFPTISYHLFFLLAAWDFVTVLLGIRYTNYYDCSWSWSRYTNLSLLILIPALVWWYHSLTFQYVSANTVVLEWVKEVNPINKKFLLAFHSPLQTILRTFLFFGKFPFTISELEVDYYHQKLNTQFASRVAKWLGKTLGNFKKTSKMLGIKDEFLVD